MTVTTYYLEMHHPDELVVSPGPEGFRVEECRVKQFELNRFMYLTVGEGWAWNERKVWTDRQWQDYAEADDLRTGLATYQGSPAGYFELHKHNDDVEIIYFGLLPKAIGKGLGAAMLVEAIQFAWQWEAQRVWLHTCTLDHPNALANYQARGLKLYKTEQE